VLHYFSKHKLKINLVSRDYYPKELEHSKHMEKMRHAATLKTPINISVQNDSLLLNYPAMMNNENTIGKIQLYYFIDFEEDHYYRMKPNLQNAQVIPLTDLAKGRYKVIFDWVTNGVDYYSESEIQL
jgi:hypothetical protein